MRLAAAIVVGGLLLFSTCVVIGNVGKERKPTTPSQALVAMLIDLVLIAAVAYLYAT